MKNTISIDDIIACKKKMDEMDIPPAPREIHITEHTYNHLKKCKLVKNTDSNLIGCRIVIV